MTIRIQENGNLRDATPTEIAALRSDLGALDAAGVRGVALTGMVLTDSGDVVATDSALTAFGKLQAKFTAIATAVRAVVLQGLVTTNAAAVAAADTVLVAIGKLQAQVDLKATPLLPVTIGPSTVLTVLNHANRQLRFTGADTTFNWPSDTGTDDLTVEIVTLAGSPGSPTIVFPDGSTAVGGVGIVIGGQRKGLNSYTASRVAGAAGNGTTNLSATQAAGNVTINSSSGTGVILPLATTSQPGLMSAAEKVALAAATATSPVTVTGSAAVGSTLTCTINGGWFGTGYQWTRNGANIAGATASTYVTQSADIGNTVTCVVTGLQYIAQGIVVAAGIPTLVSAVVNGTSLTLTFSGALTSADPTGTGGLVLTASGGASAVSGVDVTSGNAVVTATLGRSIANGETLSLAYTLGSSSAPFANAAGQVANFSGFSVTNSTPGSSQGGVITVQSIGTAAVTGGTLTLNSPYSQVGTIAAGQKLLHLELLRIASGNASSNPTDFPTTLVSNYSGAGTYGSDTGPRRITVRERTATGSESGNVVSNWDVSGAALARLMRLSGANPGWQTSAFAAGNYETTGPSDPIVASASSTIDLLPNDLVIALIANSSADGVTLSQSLTAGAATLGAVTSTPTATLGAGNHGSLTICYAAVTAGAAGVTLAINAPWTEGSPPATVVFVRVRNAIA
jgi:hypothetical protein